MLFRDYAGRVHPESEVTNQFIPAGWAGPADAPLEAVLVGGLEHIINLTPRVYLADTGAFPADDDLFWAHSNPAISGSVRVATGVSSFPFAEYLPVLETSVKGIQLGSGSKIGNDGPVDAVWLTGSFLGQPVRSQIVLVGLYSSDIVMGPIFELRRKGAPAQPPVVPSPPASSGLAEDVSQMEQILFRMRGRLAA